MFEEGWGGGVHFRGGAGSKGWIRK